MNSLQNKWSDLQISKNWRVFTAISAGLVLIAALVITFFGFNLGFDFEGGGSIDVEVGVYLSVNEDRYEDFESIVFETLDDFNLDYTVSRKFYNGDSLYGLGVRFSKVVNGKIATQEELDIIGKLLNGRQDVEYAEGAKIRQNRATVAEAKMLRNLLEGTTALSAEWSKSDSRNDEPVDYLGVYNRIEAAAFKLLDLDGVTELDYPMSALKITAGAVTPGFNFSLFWNLLWVSAVALAAVFLYMFWRFGIRAAISAAAVSIHNILVLTALAAITRVIINSAFPAILTFVLFYTLYDLSVLLARIRENKTKTAYEDYATDRLVDISVKETFVRTWKFLAAAFIGFVALAALGLIVGATEVVQFALPALLGIITVKFSSLLMAPALLTLAENNSTNKDDKVYTKATDNE